MRGNWKNSKKRFVYSASTNTNNAAATTLSIRSTAGAMTKTTTMTDMKRWRRGWRWRRKQWNFFQHIAPIGRRVEEVNYGSLCVRVTKEALYRAIVHRINVCYLSSFLYQSPFQRMFRVDNNFLYIQYYIYFFFILFMSILLSWILFVFRANIDLQKT